MSYLCKLTFFEDYGRSQQRCQQQGSVQEVCLRQSHGLGWFLQAQPIERQSNHYRSWPSPPEGSSLWNPHSPAHLASSVAMAMGRIPAVRVQSSFRDGELPISPSAQWCPLIPGSLCVCPLHSPRSQNTVWLCTANYREGDSRWIERLSLAEWWKMQSAPAIIIFLTSDRKANRIWLQTTHPHWQR